MADSIIAITIAIWWALSCDLAAAAAASISLKPKIACFAKTHTHTHNRMNWLKELSKPIGAEGPKNNSMEVTRAQ